jgi:hypothetical protein
MSQQLNKWGYMALAYLESKKPQEYQQLQQAGTLEEYALKIQQLAEKQVESYRQTFLEENPPGQIPLEQWQREEQALSFAEEEMVRELFPQA